MATLRVQVSVSASISGKLHLFLLLWFRTAVFCFRGESFNPQNKYSENHHHGFDFQPELLSYVTLLMNSLDLPGLSKLKPSAIF